MRHKTIRKALDPSRTKTIRTAFEADMVRRFKGVRRKVVAVMDNTTMPGIVTNAPISPLRFDFKTDVTKHDDFMGWLYGVIDEDILGVTKRDGNRMTRRRPWERRYMAAAYKKGILRARVEMRSQGIDIPELSQMVGAVGGMKSDDVLAAGVIGSTLSQSSLRPAHIDRAALIYARTFTELKGVTDDMARVLSRELAQGIAEGLNPKVIARRLSKKINISINRAKLIAQTEVIRAHHAANMIEYRLAGIEGVEIMLEFNTAKDSRVCAVCASLAGSRYTLDEAEALIPVHPRCRCAAIPLVGKNRNRKILYPTAAIGLASLDKNKETDADAR